MIRVNLRQTKEQRYLTNKSLQTTGHPHAKSKTHVIFHKNEWSILCLNVEKRYQICKTAENLHNFRFDNFSNKQGEHSL